MELDETQGILPPITNLLQYPIGDDVNIEEGLCKPENENLFLLSSIAFLQKQLIKKLGHQDQYKPDNVNRKYSDLLLVESGQKYKRQKCFIRLSNMEKFDEVMRSEASLPRNILSNNQILPLPKKSKSTKLSITNIFKQKSNTDIENSTKKTHSVFNIFKKNSASTKISETNLSSSANSIIHIDPERYIIIDNEEDIHSSVCSLSSISSLKNDIQQKLCNNFKIETQSEGNLGHGVNLSKYKELSDIEEEILKVIPTETNLDIKKSINEKLRVYKESSTPSLISYKSVSDVGFVKREDDFLEDPQTGIKFKCVPKVQTKPKKVKEQQSKLSVCMEDEPESDIDMFSHKRNYPFNCTDDIKALVSSETIDVIMNELLYQLEERIQE